MHNEVTVIDQRIHTFLLGEKCKPRENDPKGRKFSNFFNYQNNGMRRAEAELAEHLRELYEEELEFLHDEDKAWARAKERFGDLDQALAELEDIHHVPLWELVTRILAVIIIFLGFNLTGMQRGFFIIPKCMLLIFLLAPLAGFIKPDSNRLSSWRTWGPRLILFFGLYLVALLDGLHNYMILPFLALGLATTFLHPNFNARRTRRRVDSYVMLVVLLYVAIISYNLNENANKPDILGAGLTISFITIIYAVIISRPSLKSILVLTSILIAQVMWIYSTVFSNGFASIYMDWLRLIPMTGVAMLLIWGIYGRKNILRGLPSAILLLSIMITIHALSNLGS